MHSKKRQNFRQGLYNSRCAISQSKNSLLMPVTLIATIENLPGTRHVIPMC